MSAKPTAGYNFDFNDVVSNEQAAEAVTREQLVTLFGALNIADKHWRKDARDSALKALRAVTEFLCASPYNSNGLYSRPLELLFTELRPRPKGPKGYILQPDGSGGGAVNARISDHHVKAAAAYTIEFLCAHCEVRVMDAEKEVAERLQNSAFQFGHKNPGGMKKRDGAQTVHAWRRDFPLDVRRKGKLLKPGPAALIYRGFCANPPVTPTGDRAKDRAAIRHWFARLLVRAGYE